MKTRNAPARLLARRRYSSGLFLPRPVLVDRSLSARHLSLRPKLRFHHLPALAKVRLCNGPSGVLDSLHPLSLPKDSCGKGREFQGSLPKIRKVVSDSTPSRRISANPKLLSGKGFALGNKRLHHASISQTKFSPPNAPQTLRLLSAAPRLESQAQSILCGAPRDLKRSRPRGRGPQHRRRRHKIYRQSGIRQAFEARVYS